MGLPGAGERDAQTLLAVDHRAAQPRPSGIRDRGGRARPVGAVDLDRHPGGRCDERERRHALWRVQIDQQPLGHVGRAGRFDAGRPAGGCVAVDREARIAVVAHRVPVGVVCRGRVGVQQDRARRFGHAHGNRRRFCVRFFSGRRRGGVATNFDGWGRSAHGRRFRQFRRHPAQREFRRFEGNHRFDRRGRADRRRFGGRGGRHRGRRLHGRRRCAWHRGKRARGPRRGAGAL